MPASLPTLADRYREYSDEELVDICAAPDGDYLAEAVEAAQTELARRGVNPTETPRRQPQGEPPDPLRPRPWARYYARKIDFFLVALLWVPFAVLLAGGHEWLLIVLFLPMWLFLEPLVLSLYGTTPGKAVFRLHVEDRDGHFPTYSRALGRTLGLFAAGLGLGLPLLSLLALGASFDRLRAKGSTRWDDWSGTLVRTGESLEPVAAVA